MPSKPLNAAPHGSADRNRVYGYVRVSTENQLENYSIEEQMQRIRSYCDAKGWTLLKIYTDGGYSGGNVNRPALQSMLAAIKLGGADAVVVYKLDRLSRSQKDTMALLEDELLAYNTDFISINENFDTSSSFGKAMIGILSIFAQLEKDQITERFTMGRIGRGKAGYFHGGGNAPTGYDYVDGELIVNEFEAQAVKNIFSMFLSGKRINQIETLIAQKYGGSWTATKVRNILQNSLYTGKVKFKGQEYDGVHQPIIDEEIYSEANRLLTSSARATKFTTAQKHPFRANYLLTGLVYCSRCGARYSGNHGYYKCYSRAKSSKRFIIDPNCKNRNVPIESLDHFVVEKIRNLMNDKGMLETISSNSQSRDISPDINQAKKRIAEIDKQIEKLIDMYQISSIPIDTLSSRIDTLSNEKSVLTEMINDRPDDASLEKFISAVEAFKANFDNADLDERRLLVASIVRKIIIDDNDVLIEFRT